jgi:hypothetical protein
MVAGIIINLLYMVTSVFGVDDVRLFTFEYVHKLAIAQ